MDSPRKAIEIHELSKSFPAGKGRVTQALGAVSMAIRGGEFVALIGPSGCGKSTILRSLAGLEQPTEGFVRLNGRPPAEATRRHELGIAFQDHALLPWATIRENVALPYVLAGKRPDQERIARMLALVGLADQAASRPRQLSGGMRQRASIARALVMEPPILLLDEPFGALDAVTRAEMNEELQRIWMARPVATLLVTHGVEEAVYLADRVIVLGRNPGRILHELAIPFARPRRGDLVRSPEFHQLVDELTTWLRQSPTGEVLA